MQSRVLALAAAFVAVSTVAAAQSTRRGTAAAAFVAGHAGFVDDATIHHGVFGGALRWYLTPRISVGPEVVYMRGPDADRDLFVTGNLTFDLWSPRADRPFTPFIVVGGGVMRHTDRVGTGLYSSGEGAFTAGGGGRVRVSDRWFVGGEARVGWELHTRIAAVAGLRLR